MATIKVKPAKHASDTGTVIAIVFGTAKSIKTTEDKDRGEVFEALEGNFEAVNAETGEIFNSTLCYLPPGIHELFVAPVKALKLPSDFVEFALEISVITAKTKAGYTYIAKNITASKRVDPLNKMRRQIAAKLAGVSKQLTAGQSIPAGSMILDGQVGGNSEEAIMGGKKHKQ
jgi:hypothetical protein